MTTNEKNQSSQNPKEQLPANVAPKEEASQSSPATPPIPQEVLGALKQAGINLADPAAALIAIQLSMQATSGPLPPPSMLAEYERAIPGLGKTLVGWTTSQITHRQALEAQVTSGSQNRMNRGQYFSFGIAFSAVVGATIAAVFGHWLAAAIIVVAGVGGPATTTILARRMGSMSPDGNQTKPETSPKPDTKKE